MWYDLPPQPEVECCEELKYTPGATLILDEFRDRLVRHVLHNNCARTHVKIELGHVTREDFDSVIQRFKPHSKLSIPERETQASVFSSRGRKTGKINYKEPPAFKIYKGTTEREKHVAYLGDVALYSALQLERVSDQAGGCGFTAPW